MEFRRELSSSFAKFIKTIKKKRFYNSYDENRLQAYN